MKKQVLIALAAVIAVFASLAFVQAQAGSDAADDADSSPVQVAEQEQPFEFPHEPHVAVNQIDCQYCHFSAERSRSAGVPPLASCMGCHTYVAGEDQADDIATMRQFWEDREAIPWSRVYKVADHVYFPHMRHIAGGVECADCHGQVGEEINVIQAVEQPLTMGWCLNCHLEMDASRDCTVCHY